MKLLILLPFLGIIQASPFGYDQQGQVPLGSQDGFSLDLEAPRLIQLSDSHSPVWVSEREKIDLKANGVKFFDITDTMELGSSGYSRLLRETKASFPSPNATEKVKPVLKTLSTKGPQENLEKFTSFRTRYYRSKDGRQSQQWLLSRVREVTESSASKSLRQYINIDEFKHSWGQNTIIAKIEGSVDPGDIVVISAHQDSTNMWPFLPAPGADDDGSGTVTILESYRALLAANFRPEKSVEFHWYSAEEGGLLGSQAVASEYERQAKNVIAMSQVDMTAWVKRGTREEVGIITDYTDEGLTEFNKKLVKLYLNIPYVETKCGYACSDHASWRKAGYPSVFTIESAFENSNQNIHSTNDRIDISDEFSFDHMLEFSKLAVAFAIELGGWSQK
ncbi:Zn-dependent exopeptidase [Marasmius fiardii PR-910]|nr:Zn-dependent exopeptidase [Marasmius fiardii PR-910]